jgi:hypothetical protein
MENKNLRHFWNFLRRAQKTICGTNRVKVKVTWVSFLRGTLETAGSSKFSTSIMGWKAVYKRLSRERV